MIDPDDVTRRDLSRFVNTDSTIGLEALIGQNYVALAQAYAGDRSMTDVAELATTDPGVAAAFVCLAGTDAVSQRFWHYMDTEAIRRVDVDEDERRTLERQVEALGATVDSYYEFVDELVGELEALADDNATIAIVTDHGYTGVTFDAAGLPRVGSHMHSESGMWIVSGPEVAPGARAEGTSLIDVAPTIMAASSIPLPGNLDGEALAGLLER
jgi:predicted AlkP superfamily phosphohydrolase/phosphomutase